jgi:hypothetical protein
MQVEHVSTQAVCTAVEFDRAGMAVALDGRRADDTIVVAITDGGMDIPSRRALPPVLRLVQPPLTVRLTVRLTALAIKPSQSGTGTLMLTRPSGSVNGT